MISSSMLWIFLALLYCKAVLFESDEATDLESWFKKYDIQLSGKETTKAVYLLMTGCTTITQCVNLWSDPNRFPVTGLPDADAVKLHHAALETLEEMIFMQWLHKHGLSESKHVFFTFGIRKLDELQKFHQLKEAPLKGYLSDSQYTLLAAAVGSLPLKGEDGFEKLESTLSQEVLAQETKSWIPVGMVFVSLFVVALGIVRTMSSPPHCSGTTKQHSFFAYFTGKYLSLKNCTVAFEWEDPHPVGSTMCFVVRFYQRNGQAYPICDEDNLLIEVTQGNNKVACSIELGGTQPCDANKAKVQFTVRRSGEYHISVLINMIHIKGSPFSKTFLPGPPDPLKTSFVHHCSTVVCSECIPYQLFVEPRDRFGNLCNIGGEADTSSNYSVDITEVSSQKPMPEAFYWEDYPLLFRKALVLIFGKEGCYHAAVSYKGQSLQNGDFNVIVLNKEEALLVQKNVAKKSQSYSSKLLSLNGERLNKPKKVYCCITPKQLTVKEYLWYVIPSPVVTFRVCPSTKFHFRVRNEYDGEPVLMIDDGCRSEVELMSQDRNVIAATFTQFLLKNIGGSETFKDKQDFFHHEVRKFHQKHFHDKLQIKISRDKLLESSLKATKHFSTSDWCKNFEITFAGEEGLDWGGLRREWFELVCSSLFDPQNSLFHSFKNDKQGLVHPVPSRKRPDTLNKKYYEFAGKIVGKCLYESALGSSYRQLVKAKFTRSFLAQLIGLRVHYKYFEHDDPDLYVSKIKYILENDVNNMGLFFMEEEYSGGKLVREIELVEGGALLPVTNQNKLQYLDALAQHRLADSIKEEIMQFLKGLNELIPDNLLCIFDENELELLMCGTGHYSIADFKANHNVSGSSYEFRKVLDWFWTAVSNFSEEEMARLLQFTTGCSQLPPGGFSELSPKFQITAAPTFGSLPTAHTCFNQLCLPDYDSYEQFERAMRLAINEGAEGFGMI